MRLAATMIETNFTGHVTALLAFGEAMRRRGSGTIVVLSSVAAVRPRKFNSVYGATKAGLDAFARGYADSLHGTGVRVLLVRPGFVVGRMTEGMKAAPLATTPRGRRRGGRERAAQSESGRSGPGIGKSVIWVPAPLVGLGDGDEAHPAPGLAQAEGLAAVSRAPPSPGYPCCRPCSQNAIVVGPSAQTKAEGGPVMGSITISREQPLPAKAEGPVAESTSR